MANSLKHQIHKARGDAGEAFAIKLYKSAMFEIITTDLRIGRSQIDFLAKRNACFHFVEVKYRKTMEAAHLAINQAQLGRIAHAALTYMQDHPQANWQIDALLIDKDFNWQRIDNISFNMH